MNLEPADKRWIYEVKTNFKIPPPLCNFIVRAPANQPKKYTFSYLGNSKCLLKKLPPGFKTTVLLAVYFFSKSGIMNLQENDLQKNLQPPEVK
jgi:hypothetical protein